MTYQDRERRRLSQERDKLFKDPGMGVFFKKPREFVLSEAPANLWDGIREDALDYFSRNNIAWWGGKGDDPTGHMLSSQIACVNHLYFLRQRRDLATAILQNLDSEIAEAEIVDDGYVAFEFIGQKPYLKERSFLRGAHCTSVDAFMIGRTSGGDRRAFLIEWKYTESYQSENLYKPERAAVYDHLISAVESPFNATIKPADLYFEPFYQMMRQTLLGWQICVHKDHKCTSYRNVHVAPRENTELYLNITAPGLTGANISEAWSRILKHPEFYITTTPVDLMRPVLIGADTKSATTYLQRRYWAGA